MRTRISVATMRRLDTLSKPAVVNCNGGLLAVPRVLSVDDWQAAVRAWHQRLLMLDPQVAAMLIEPEPSPPPASYSIVR